MKKYIIIIIVVCCYSLNSLKAQPIPSLFRPLSWEQASLMAARENKLVLVEVGKVDPKIEGNLQKHRELMNYMQRSVVAIRMDMTTVQGREFEPRLLLYPYPVFAFFMPYGDLVGIISPDEVAIRPEALRDAFQKARDLSDLKKNNSRSIDFTDMGLARALVRAGQEGKQVFVYVCNNQKQACLLMEKNIFHLDRVADLYNQNFVNLQVDSAELFLQKYGITEVPVFLFLNATGKVLYRAAGSSSVDQFTEYAKLALEKAEGVAFEKLTDGEAQEKSRRESKLIFRYLYTPGSSHKEILRTLFVDPELTDFFSEHFVNVKRESEESVFIFSDPEGQELHRIVGAISVAELLEDAKKVVRGKGLAYMDEMYRKGEKRPSFIEEYIQMLTRANRKGDASGVTTDYLTSLSVHCLKEEKYWNYFNRYVITASPVFFDYVLGHREELFRLYGEESVRKKIAALWIAGAENYVIDGVFDELGFKEYTKRLKKEKVEGWRFIVRNARMHSAEKVGDWKTFITLAEEKWNEEQIPDSELYGWGVKINESCRDEGVRYKMAQWLASKVMEMERKEQVTGRIKMSSYKGFFEKLVDDLLKKN